MLPAKKGFLGLERGVGSPQARAPKARLPKVRVLPFPLEKSVSYGGGTKRGPQAILNASHEVELYDEEFGCEAVARYGVETAPAPRVATSMTAALAQIEAAVRASVKANRFPLILGGEHALTPAAVRPLLERHKDLVLLHFDAHADLRDGYAGERYSHAAAMRRVLDNPAVRIVSFGVRNISAEEVAFAKRERRVTIHWARDKKKWNLARALAPLKNKPVYITFDLDAFDASLMPATGTPEPGGLFWDDAMAVLRASARVAKQIVGADVVELAPQPRLHSADFVAAKLAYKILNYALIPKTARSRAPKTNN